jgi:hypothetical protein
MKKLVLLVLACAVCLWAADFWTSKPYTDWNTKELQKIMNDSPWSHRVDVELSVRMPTTKSQSESGGRGRGGGGGGGGISTADGAGEITGGGGGGGGRGGAGGAGGEDGPVTQTIPVMLVWQTALPVKQALMKAKYGAEAATSPDSKTFLERPEQFYVINVAGLPGYAAQAVEGDKKAAVLQLTALNIKGKDSIHAVEVQINRRERVVDAMFFFPRNNPVTADDKDMEFATKFDKLTVKYHFKPKEMVYHGKLEM